MLFSIKTALLCLVAIASAAPAISPNPHNLETRMAKIPADGVQCRDGTFISKAEIQDAIGKGRRRQTHTGYPKDHGNHEKFFKAFDSGRTSTLEEYPIIPNMGTWDGRNQGKYRVITVIGKTSGPYVGVVQHKAGISGAFYLCTPAPAAGPSCSRSTTRSVVRDLWYRATKGKGKAKAKGKSDSCQLPTTKKPKTKTPTTTKPKTKTPKKTKKTKKPKKTTSKKTKAKMPKSKKPKKATKTKGKKKGGKL